MLKPLARYILTPTVLALGFHSTVIAKSTVEPPKGLPALNKTIKGTIIEPSLKSPTLLKSLVDNPANTDWFNLSPSVDNAEGASVNLAYDYLYADDDHDDEPIIVAVIDSGVDVTHEDLQGKIWFNEDEIPNNGIDDDHNGFIDDINGWNFIGGRDGQEVGFDTLEVTREYARYTKMIEDGVILTEKQQAYFERVKADYEPNRDFAEFHVNNATQHQASSIQNKAFLAEKLSMTDFSRESLNAIDSSEPDIIAARDSLLSTLDFYGSYEIIPLYIQYFGNQLNYYYNTEFDTRATIVKDDPDNLYENNYGNNNVMPYDSSHGTHVAGIIAASRSNQLGIKGVANNVKIMALRAVPNGDERDKDIANSVRYAVDNGAKIINMSFGKGYSPNKPVVDRAFAYAARRGVLLVHSAGNSSENIDSAYNYPNPYPARIPRRKIRGWLEVGASTHEFGESLAAGYSNFGKRKVDLFAPGSQILSTIANNQYASYSGTSMASPVVSGIAALLLSYDDDLKPKRLKKLLMKSVRTYPGLLVQTPGTGDLILFSELSKSGGVVDANNAMMRLVD
ncbi:S8 family serine peptidase [Aliikangiella sp. IMCC44359]|uniref:S8 family serine peptidase n=1 Tax=Aliikangiella sp. IMCC44359 TaxID=3459125 RepID=UPI00403AFD8C